MKIDLTENEVKVLKTIIILELVEIGSILPNMEDTDARKEVFENRNITCNNLLKKLQNGVDE